MESPLWASLVPIDVFFRFVLFFFGLVQVPVVTNLVWALRRSCFALTSDFVQRARVTKRLEYELEFRELRPRQGKNNSILFVEIWWNHV